MASTPVAVVDVSALALGPLDIALRMFMAMLIGAVIGTEREYTHRPAGMRTHMLVALGACAVMTTSQLIFWQYRPYGATPDPARLSAQVITGLGFLGDVVENPTAISYGEIPHFKASTAPGHAGRLVFGTLAGRNVAVMQGRMHHYEGYGYDEVSYAVRVLRLLGCDTLIVTNAAGCVRTDWQAGDLMLITDHIKMFSESPLRGANLPEFGVRFPDASHLYTVWLQETARRAAAELSTPPLMATAVRSFIQNLPWAFC